MTEPFTETETDRTKSRWVARAYRDFVTAFGRPRTTLRALFYYALQRPEEDYPICGGFVGEIRATRHYHESDGDRLPKWVGRAKILGFIPADAIIDESPGEHVLLPKNEKKPFRVELWLNRSSFDTLLSPVCEKHGVTLVSTSKPSKGTVESLFRRCEGYATIILCLSDLSIGSLTFCRDLDLEIGRTSGAKDIRVKCIGLTAEQVLSLKIPQVPDKSKGSAKNEALYKGYLKPYGLSPRRMVELDALEVYYPGGIAAFIDNALLGYEDIDKGEFLADRGK
jgi:hypothetical protein